MPRSVEVKLAVGRANFGWPDQSRVRDCHRMQRPFQLTPPEIEKFLQLWKARKQIVILPDIDLQQSLMVRQAIENFRGGEPVGFDLLAEVLRDHATLRIFTPYTVLSTPERKLKH